MKIRTLLIGAATMFTVGLFSNNAQAQENWSNFPGGKCVKALTNGTLRVNFGRAENTSSNQSLRVHCPVDRQLVATGGIATGTQVWVIDTHPTQAVECSLEIRNISNNTRRSRQTLRTPVNRDSNVPFRLTFSAATATSNDVFMISCLIPPNFGGISSVVGVRIEESGVEIN